jgi:hypothetical protein
VPHFRKSWKYSKTDQKHGHSKSLIDENSVSMTESQIDKYCRPSDVSFGKIEAQDQQEIEIVQSKIKSLKIGEEQSQ